jgi:hypothetical protein
MADVKITKEEASMQIMTHLQIFAGKIQEVVQDYNEMEASETVGQDGKEMFAAACMKDVAGYAAFLAEIVSATARAGGLGATPPPDDTQEEATEADVIDLQSYREKGGLLN